MLFNEPKLLKYNAQTEHDTYIRVSVLFNESKLLKFVQETIQPLLRYFSFSTLQRVEIAEIAMDINRSPDMTARFSTLQRVEIAEIHHVFPTLCSHESFSTLQRVEIAEITGSRCRAVCGSEFQYSSTSRNC